MVEWTDDAIADAIKAHGDARMVVPSSREDWIRAALNAAVKVQFSPNTVAIPYQMAHQSGANWALENAVKIAEFYGAWEAAESIRNLAKGGK